MKARKGEKEDMEEGRRERKEIQRKVEGARKEGDEREGRRDRGRVRERKEGKESKQLRERE